MQFSLITILEAIMLASALSMDAFVSGFAYGSNKIKIPMLSVQIINIICSSILGISLLVGTVLKQYIPSWLTLAICFIILFTLGVVKLLDSVTKSIIRKHNHLDKEIEFSMFNFKFILNLYANPEEADVDASKVISPIEASSLAIALSLDGMAIGFGAALGNINALAVFLCSLVTDAAAIILGCYIGNKIARKLSFNLSWLSGVLLIILAFLKLF
ncbi:sporulation membrane protein YtaF [Alkaliphilus sp. B6464]|uniref:sporulation membrane protein YtaF n=1 Tax=Alkaliphilus sp. B6464 TaxID=2731219 RepID=UPI00201290EE|nr:sporulation membrane protein YtaF [Alkaliphilus sp. B6464]